MSARRLVTAGLLAVVLLSLWLFSTDLHQSSAAFSATTMNVGNMLSAGSWPTVPPAKKPEPVPAPPDPATAVVKAPPGSVYSTEFLGFRSCEVTLRWLPPATATRETTYNINVRFAEPTKIAAVSQRDVATTEPYGAVQSVRVKYPENCIYFQTFGRFEVQAKLTKNSVYGPWTKVWGTF